jgi:hypothetical protein
MRIQFPSAIAVVSTAAKVAVLSLGVIASALVLMSTVISAQGASTGVIAGEVRDATGAVLPGMTVEAAGAALIDF